MKFERLLDSYYHIDNGGIEFEFGIYRDPKDNEDPVAIPAVKIGTQYFGYTALSAELQGLELTPSVLRSIGTKFIEFAALVEDHNA